MMAADEGSAQGRPLTRRVVSENGAWTWILPAVPVSASARAAGPGPVPAPIGPVRFVASRESAVHAETEVFRGVEGRTAVADVLRVPDPLPPDAERHLPGTIHQAVAQRPRGTGAPGAADESPVWTAAREFLDACGGVGVRAAAHVRSLLGERPPDPAFGHYGSHRVLGLGRLVITESAGVPHYDRVDVLLPAAPAPQVLDTCRTLAEIVLTSRLFAAAKKRSAPSLLSVADALSALAAGDDRFAPDVLRLGTGVLMVDHARRLAAQVGLDPSMAAVEMAVIREALTSRNPSDGP